MLALHQTRTSEPNCYVSPLGSFGDIAARSRRFGFAAESGYSAALLVRNRGFISLEKAERDCVPHHAVLSAPGLWLASPKNGNISNVGWRLSAISR
jgi:hypothetical protein